MKLYLQKNSFSWSRPTPLTDRAGRTRFLIVGNAFSCRKEIQILNSAKQEVVSIRMKVPSIMPQYEIFVGGKLVCTILKDLTFANPRCTIKMMDWELSGSVGLMNYEIVWQNTIVAANLPEQDSKGDRMILDFYDRTTELTALGVMVAVNCILAPQFAKAV